MAKAIPTFTVTFTRQETERLSRHSETRLAQRHAGNPQVGGEGYDLYTYVALCGERAYVNGNNVIRKAEPAHANLVIKCDRCRRILGLKTWRQYLNAAKSDSSLTWAQFAGLEVTA